MPEGRVSGRAATSIDGAEHGDTGVLADGRERRSLSIPHDPKPSDRKMRHVRTTVDNRIVSVGSILSRGTHESLR